LKQLDRGILRFLHPVIGRFYDLSLKHEAIFKRRSDYCKPRGTRAFSTRREEVHGEEEDLIPIGSGFTLHHLLLSSVISSLHVNIAGNIMQALGNAVLPPQSL
jgi:hypothetical protein